MAFKIKSAAMSDELYQKDLLKSTEDLKILSDSLDAAGVSKTEVLFQLTTAELQDTLMAVDYNDEYEYDVETLADICIQCSEQLGEKKSLSTVLREYGNPLPEDYPDLDTPEGAEWLASRKAKNKGYLTDEEIDRYVSSEEMDTLAEA